LGVQVLSRAYGAKIHNERIAFGFGSVDFVEGMGMLINLSFSPWKLP